ncbi:MAG: metallophosphoesterase [Gammaproteobacteria bacterium]
MSSSLIADLDRYTVQYPPVKCPDVVIVSGDIIQGAPHGNTNFREIQDEQYHQAELLLAEICNRFVDGDRSKLAICAGNHDVCWNTAFSAMEQVSDKCEIEKLSYSDFYGPESIYRWSWKEKQAYKIVDINKYNNRTSRYWDFVEKFYKETELEFPIDRNSGYSLFEVDNGKVVVACFNSTMGNDCFAFHGAISSREIANCSLKLRDADKKYALKIGVWHHGCEAHPPSQDYISTNPLSDLSNHGFGLGLHGHQHSAAHNVQYVHIPEQRRLPIVSAGSLCAGAKELPVGRNRQYNIIEISDNYLSGLVHVRERTRGNIFTAAMRPEFGINGAIDLEFDPPDMRAVQAGSNLGTVAENHDVVKAEGMVRSGDNQAALEILSSSDLDGNHFARKLFFEAVQECESWAILLARVSSARSISELALICEALAKTKGADAAIQAAKSFDTTSEQDDKMRREIIDGLVIKKMMGK